MPAELLLGARLFKVGLIMLGALIIALGMILGKKREILTEKLITNSSDKLPGIILSMMLAVALVLRLYGIDYGLWYDEMRTHVQYMGMSFGEILTTYDSENNHVLFTLLARASFGLFNESPWSIRLPAVLFGVASIWALYLLARQVASLREALLSAAFLTVSYHHVWFSQNARGYMGLLLWTIIASWLFLRSIRENIPTLWLLYAASAALGVYTHMTMIFVIIGHFVVYLTVIVVEKDGLGRERWEGLLFGFFMAGFLTLFLYAFVLPQIFSTIGEQSNVSTWKNPLWTVIEFAKGIRVGFASTILAMGALFLVGAGVLSFARENPVILGFLFIPAFLGAAVVMIMGHPLWPRFFFFTMGFGILLIVRGTTMFGRIIGNRFRLKPRGSAIFATGLCSALIIASMISLPRAYAPKQDYAGALTFVNEHKDPGDAVLTVGLTRFPYKSFFKTDWKEVESQDEIISVSAHAKRTWLLYTLPLHLKGEYPGIMDIVKRDFKVVKKFYGTLNDGTNTTH
jgi:uncharacterized membrane protein